MSDVVGRFYVAVLPSLEKAAYERHSAYNVQSAEGLLRVDLSGQEGPVAHLLRFAV